MALLLPVFLITAAYLCGRLLYGCTKKRETLPPVGETCLLGMFALLLLWEAMVLPAIKLLLSFHLLTQLYSVALLLMCGGGVIVSFRHRVKDQGKMEEKWFSLTGLMAVVIFAGQVLSFLFFYPDTTRDMTVETVITTLSSDLVYENHPRMGTTFLYGITFRGKLVSLPLFYAYLAQISGSSAVSIVYRLAPVMSLLLNYAAYSLWIRLFTEQGEDRRRKAAFCFLVLGLLNLSGSFAHDSIFYYLIHKGFRGETIIFGTVLPYVLYLCQRIYVHNEYHRFLFLGLALAATVPLTDVQRGLLPCLIVAVVSSLIALAGRIGKKVKRA